MTPPASSIDDAAGLRVRRLPELYDAEWVFAHLYAESEWAFWLDTAMVSHGRFSFIGDSAGPLGFAVTYDVRDRHVRLVDRGRVDVFEESIFDYLTRQLASRRQAYGELPFDFNCGFAGYFGYELKAECDGSQAHESPLPDAAFVFADRLIAFDHLERCTWLVSLVSTADPRGAKRWFDEIERRLACLSTSDAVWSPSDAETVEFELRRGRERYLDDIDVCRDRLMAGETYEVCLTNKVVAPALADPLAVYRALRRLNPAPYGAYLRLGDAAVLSSSPERFLRIDRDRWAEARPIKGTRRRGDSASEDASLAEGLRSDAKTRAENVTIVDLIRNDLGIVCEVGTVHVAELMEVETYMSLHQLVSTVRGRLRDGVTVADAVRACFPPGSMTGAPKKRTMEILDQLEEESRGPYSGAIGYLGLGGAADLSVAIRCIVNRGDSATIGCGGAIVLDSEPAAEYEEMLLKAWAPMRAIDPGLLPRSAPVAATGADSVAGARSGWTERATRLR